MPFDFSNAPTDQMGDFDLIHHGTLAWAVFRIKPFNYDQGLVETPSKSSDGAYLNVDLTICDGPFSKRKVFEMIGVKGSEEYVNQGRAAIRAILEVGKGASQSNLASYRINDFTDLDGLKVAVKIKIEKGANGFGDKNRVAAWLTPNPDSPTAKDWARLLAGDTAGKAAASVAAKPATAAPAWAAPTTPTQQPAAQPAQPQPGGKPSWL